MVSGTKTEDRSLGYTGHTRLTFTRTWLTIFGIPGAFLYGTETVRARAGRCRTGEIYHRSLAEVVHAQL